jgi:sugar O-acyltransferase (sialic acid O-acetyltransferase NeuD family)
MSARELLLLGAGGHAESCLDVIETTGAFDVVGLLGTPAEVGRMVLGQPVVGSDDALAAWVARVPQVLVAVGQLGSASLRIRLFEAARAAGARFPTIVSSRAHVSRHATLGEGTIVHHGAVVNAGARVGANCIVNSLALVEHGATVGDHCHVSTGARLNSGVTVGEASFVGSGAVVRQLVRIGTRTVVGMGQVVTHDVADATTLMTLRS